MDTYFIDGDFVTADKAVISVNDLTVLRGYGIFDFMRTYNRRPFYLHEHVERLENSAKLINLELKWSHDEIYDAVMKTIEKNPQHDELNIRIVYSGGVSPDGVIPAGNGKLMVMATDKHALPDWWYTDGTKVITEKSERYIPGAKSTNYLGAVMAQQNAKKEGAVEAIYVDKSNNIHEGTTTNIFFFKGDKMITTDTEILPGVTRRVVLKLTEGVFDTELRNVSLDEIDNFDEILICASNKEIVPVIQIDDKKIGNGKPGKNTEKIMKLFREYTTKYGQEKN